MSFYDEEYGIRSSLGTDGVISLEDIAPDIAEVFQEVKEQFRTLREEAEALDDQVRISEILDCMNAEAQRKLVHRIGPAGYQVSFEFGLDDDSVIDDDSFIFGESYFRGGPSA